MRGYTLGTQVLSPCLKESQCAHDRQVERAWSLDQWGESEGAIERCGIVVYGVGEDGVYAERGGRHGLDGIE